MSIQSRIRKTFSIKKDSGTNQITVRPVLIRKNELAALERLKNDLEKKDERRRIGAKTVIQRLEYIISVISTQLESEQTVIFFDPKSTTNIVIVNNYAVNYLDQSAKCIQDICKRVQTATLTKMEKDKFQRITRKDTI